VEAQVGAGTKARAGSDVVDAEVGGFQEFADDVDAGPEQPLQGRMAGVRDEAARERPVRDMGVLGEVTDGEVLMQPGQRPRPGTGEGLAGVRWQRSRHVLGLAAVAVRSGDDVPGDVVRDAHAEVPAYQVQAQVDTGGDAR
jgi:hypothetical protein